MGGSAEHGIRGGVCGLSMKFTGLDFFKQGL